LRSATPASGHRSTVVGAERLPHAAANATPVAFHLDIQSLTAGPNFVEVKQAFAIRIPGLMDEIHPREIIEMSMLTRHHEARWQHQRGSALRCAVVDVTSPVGAVWKHLRLKQPGTDRGQQPALRANHPAGKRCDRHADLPGLIEPVGLRALSFWPSWWSQE